LGIAAAARWIHRRRATLPGGRRHDSLFRYDRIAASRRPVLSAQQAAAREHGRGCADAAGPAARPAKPAKHTSTMATEAQIKEAQTDLSKAGLYKGAVSGTMNKEFEAALKKYQTAHKLKATGHVDEATLAALRKA
jgi:peptidoglycan hydrolase-like protein with peptidoglycan-binding domain